MFTDAVVLNSPTVENFYKSFNEVTSFISSVEPTLSTLKFPTFSNFTKVEEFDSQSSMKSVAVDGKKVEKEVVNDGIKKLNARRKMMAFLYDLEEQRNEKEKLADFKARTDGVNHALIEKIFNVYAPNLQKATGYH